MSFVAVAVAGVTAVGTLAASSSAASASRDATRAQTNAAAADRALAREQRDKNEQLFAPYLQDENMAKAWADALAYGSSSYTPAGASSPITITRDQVMGQIAGTPLAQLADTTFAGRNDITNQTYSGDQALAGQEYDANLGAGDQNYADSTSAAEAARTGRSTQAQANLDQRLANNANTYAAWDAQARDQANRAIDLNFSRGGVTGNVGSTRAGVAQVGQQYALDAYGKLVDLNAAAYDPYYSDINHATDTYYNDVGAATDARNSNRTAATATRGNRNQNAYDAYRSGLSSNYDTYAGDRASAYGDFQDFLRGRQSTGFNARSQIAAGGQAYVNSATAANNNAANAIAQGAYQRGQIQQQTYADLANIVGNAYGAITNRKPTSSTGGEYWNSTPPGYASTYNFSDPRLKTDVEYSHTDANGLRWWRYRYLWDGNDTPLRIGVMATEAPAHAVRADPDGYLMVDYSKLGAVHG